MPGFIPFDISGNIVFNAAIDMGATPAQAYEAATSALTQIAEHYGMPQGGWDADLDAAEDAFQESLDAGSAPQAAYTAARTAGGEAAADWAAENAPEPGSEGDVPPEDAGDVVGFIPFDIVGKAVFELAMDLGLNNTLAFQEATEAMTQLAEDLGMPQDGWTADVNAAADAYQAALADGKTPSEAFGESREAGADAAADWAAEHDPGTGAEGAEGAPPPPGAEGGPDGPRGEGDHADFRDAVEEAREHLDDVKDKIKDKVAEKIDVLKEGIEITETSSSDENPEGAPPPSAEGIIDVGDLPGGVRPPQGEQLWTSSNDDDDQLMDLGPEDVGLDRWKAGSASFPTTVTAKDGLPVEEVNTDGPGGSDHFWDTLPPDFKADVAGTVAAADSAYKEAIEGGADVETALQAAQDAFKIEAANKGAPAPEVEALVNSEVFADVMQSDMSPAQMTDMIITSVEANSEMTIVRSMNEEPQPGENIHMTMPDLAPDHNPADNISMTIPDVQGLSHDDPQDNERGTFEAGPLVDIGDQSNDAMDVFLKVQDGQPPVDNISMTIPDLAPQDQGLLDPEWHTLHGDQPAADGITMEMPEVVPHDKTSEAKNTLHQEAGHDISMTIPDLAPGQPPAEGVLLDNEGIYEITQHHTGPAEGIANQAPQNLGVDGNGEVIGANPYISTDTEKLHEPVNPVNHAEGAFDPLGQPPHDHLDQADHALHQHAQQQGHQAGENLPPEGHNLDEQVNDDYDLNDTGASDVA